MQVLHRTVVKQIIKLFLELLVDKAFHKVYSIYIITMYFIIRNFIIPFSLNIKNSHLVERFFIHINTAILNIVF